MDKTSAGLNNFISLQDFRAEEHASSFRFIWPADEWLQMKSRHG